MTVIHKPQIEKVKLYIGGATFSIGILSPLLIPLVTSSNLSVGIKTILSGLLAFGIPEIFMLIAIAIMGKSGYSYLKEKLFSYLKVIAPSDSVSLIRYRIGLVMFSMPLLVGVLQPYLAYYFTFFKELPLWWAIGLDILFISSFFVLGGDFWDKLSGLFKHNAKITINP